MKRPRLRRFLTKALLSVFACAIIGGIGVSPIYWSLNRTGRNAWKDYKEQWAGRGYQTTVDKLIPSEVEADTNFFSSPSISESLAVWDGEPPAEAPLDTIEIRRLGRLQDRQPPPERRASWRAAQPIRLCDYIRDSDKISNPAAAQIILEEMASIEPILTEIASAARSCPHARFKLTELRKPVLWLSEARGSDHRDLGLFSFAKLAYTYQTRSLAYLAADAHGDALKDIATCLALSKLATDMPGLNNLVDSHLCAALAMQTIWEGLRSQVWDRRQLDELQKQLGSSHLTTMLERSIRFELVCEFNYLDQLLQSGDHSRLVERFHESLTPSEHRWSEILGRIAPSGLYYHNMVTVGETCEVLLTTRSMTCEDVGNFDAVVHQPVKGFDARRDFARLHPMVAGFKYLATMVNFVAIQQDVHLAEIAVALERFRLAEGTYPHALSDLEPEFLDRLPPDLAGNGHAYRYELPDDGRPTVYSVGYDQIDDGAIPVKNRKHGDWAWQYTLPAEFDLAAYALSTALDE